MAESEIHDNADGTVTDNRTGLIWLRDANAFSNKCNWATALTDCATLNSGAWSNRWSVEGDWRLPNVQELQSLIDYADLLPRCATRQHRTMDVGRSVHRRPVGYYCRVLRSRPL